MLPVHFVLVLMVVARVNGGTKQKRIIEPNEDAEEDEHPWMALLTDPNDGFCGGVILNRCYVLTVAHCFKIGEPINKVIFGVHRSYLPGGITYQSESTGNSFTYKIHKDAKSRTDWIPDIALIRLSKPLTYTKDKIEPIALSDEPPKKGWTLIAYGWGYHSLSKKGKRQNILKKRADQIHKCSDIDCTIRPEITGNGDSGGPWITQGEKVNGTSKPCLIGLTESSPRNGVDRFTSIAEYVNNGWIVNTMEKMDKKQTDECNGILSLDTCKPDTTLKQRCSDLTLKDNMVLLSGSLTKNVAGDIVTLTCNKNYMAVGSTQFLCTSQGTWKPDIIYTECRKY